MVLADFWARPAAAVLGYLALLMFLIFNDFCQVSCLKIYRSDLRQILKVRRTVAVDDQSEISLSISQGTLPRQPIFVGLIHTTEFQ